MPQAFTTDDGISSPWRQLEITRECKRLLENTRHHHASNWDYTRTSVVQVDCCSIQQSSHHLHLTIPCLEGSKMPCTQVWITSLTATAWSTVEPPYRTRLDQKIYRMSSFQGWIHLHRQGVFGRWGVLTTGVWNRGVPLHTEYNHILRERCGYCIYSCILYTQWSQMSPCITTPHSATTHFYHLVKTQS